MQRHFRFSLYVLQLVLTVCLVQTNAVAQSSCPGFKTFTQGGWGSTPNGNNPGTILNNGFSTAFPNGLTIGCNNKFVFTSPSAVRAFLPNGGTAAVLPAGTLTNPTKTSYSNVMAGQLVALALNIGFDQALPSFGASCANLSNLVIASGPFSGMTVQQLFDNANAKIGGCTAMNKTLSEYVTAMDNINKNYDNGVISGSFLVCPPLVANCEPRNITCFGANNGSINVSVTSGTCPYTYSWNIQGAGNVSSVSNLAPGTYTVTITDAVGKVTTCTNTITQPSELSVSDDHADVKCNRGSDGSVTVSFNGGTAPYTVAFNGGAAVAQTSPAVYSSLSAGSYSWVVTDANGCTKSGSETVGEPSVLEASDDHANVKCNGGTDGSVSLSFSGGTAPYTVSFNGGEATAQTSPALYSSLSAGSYSWTVTDANGCTQSGSESVEEPSALVATDDHTNNACHGGTEGSVSVSFSGGTAPYTVSFNGGEASEQTSPVSYSSLSAGSYSWTVTDANGCSQSGSESVEEPTEISANEEHTNVSCNGGNNGSVTLTFEGGTGPYSVSFVNNTPAPPAPQAEEGDVFIDISNGSPKGYVFTFGETLFGNSSETLLTDVDFNTAVITTNVALPSIPGLVSQTSPAAYNNLSVGSYNWTIVDANGCVKTGTVEITEPEALVASSIHNDITCARGSNGAVVISFAGGVTPYSLNFNGSVSNPTSSPDKYLNLSAGTYEWTITDANGCSQNGSETIVEPESMQLNLNTTPDSRCGDAICDGSATVSVTSGGTAPYTYTWTINGSVAASQTTSTASELCPNSAVYVAIVDSKGCTGSSAIDTIRCINGPVASPDSTTTPPNTPVNGTLKNNDTPNPQCPNNMWSLVSNPHHGTVTVQSNGDYTYTPANGFTGLDTFYYKICDCNSMCDTSYAVIYIAGTANCVPLTTFSQGGWGATNNPAKVYLHANFASSFPNGITLGCGSNLVKFTTPQAITNWLPAGTNNYLLPNGTLTNPSNAVFNSNLVGQLLAATLSVGFDAANASFASGDNVLGSMYYQSAPFIGMTVNQIIAEANKLIGGCATSFTNAQLGVALANINLNYDGVGVDNGNLTCTATQPTTQGGRLSSMIAANMFPNPATTSTNVFVEGNAGETAIINLYDLSGRLLKTQKVVLNASRTTVSMVVSDIQSQTCLVKITKGGQTTTSKLVVKH